MIAVDTSAVMAILLREPVAENCKAALESETELVMSAGTLAETLIVACRRNIVEEADRLVSGLGVDIAPITAASARRIAEAYRKWGRGAHPASLNFGDCFAYEVAKEHGCPLLFVGDDFSKTDIESAL
jgi:ribonuclease VapC